MTRSVRANSSGNPQGERVTLRRRGGRRSAEFVPGLRLSEAFFEEIIEPILKKNFPGLRYSAGLVGTGSEVLGYDTERSRDHNWGPRLFVFLSERDYARDRNRIDKALRRSLPRSFLGYPTSFSKPDEVGVRLPEWTASGEVDHYVLFLTIRSFFKGSLGIDPYERLEPQSWLVMPPQRLLEVTEGKLFHDDLGLSKVIERFDYYPRDIWLYLLAAQWARISQEEAFVGRTAEVGDELGARIISARLVKELMELCFLMERRYTPYSKWFGSAFRGLEISKELMPVSTNAMSAGSLSEREKWLSRAYRIVAKRHNSLKITRPLTTEVSKFHTRPYLVIHADKFAAEIRREIGNRYLRRFPLIGSINQLTDNSSVLEERSILERFRNLYKD